MKKIILTVILSLIISAAWASTWDNAVEIYSESIELNPHKMSISSRTFDNKNELEKTEKQVFLLDYSLDADNPERELIQATEDGTDVTAEKRRDLEKGNRGRGGPPRGMEDMQKMPLDPEVQQDVVSSYSGKTEYKSGTDCEVWDFEIKLNDKYTGVGTAWLDRDTGAAQSIEYRIEPLFPFVENMNMSLDFSIDPLNRVVLSRMNMEGRVNMIIMKKGFKSTIEFSDYK